MSVFHLEEGEYLLEFEYGAATEFDMVVLKMMGGHGHHHHHGHGSGPYEWVEFSVLVIQLIPGLWRRKMVPRQILA